MAPERRESQRFTIQLNKIAGAQITQNDGTQVPCYVYVRDIGEGGMRITTDTWLDANQRFHLYLQLNPPLNAQVEVVWNKQLTGGTNVYGLRFVDMSADLQSQIEKFIHSFTQEGLRLRKSISLNRVICMQFPALTHDKRVFVLTNVLSTMEMQITTECGFELGQHYDCLLFLQPDDRPVVVRATVNDLRPMVFDRFKVHFSFERLSPDGVEGINNYLDRVISGEIDRLPGE